MAESIVKDISGADIEFAMDTGGSAAIDAGDIVVLESGYAVAGKTATGLRAKGIAKETASVAAGDKTVVVQTSNHPKGQRAFKLKSVSGGNAVTQAHVGSNCYVENAKTVTMLATGRSVCGEVMRIDADGDPWVVFPR